MSIIQNRGLRGLPGLNSLSSQERSAFMAANADKLKKYRRPGDMEKAAEIIYNNQQFIEKFGQEEFDKLNNGSKEAYDLRNQLLREKVIGDAVEENFKPTVNKSGLIDENTGAGRQWEKIQQLSTDAKEKLLNSEWKTPGQMQKEKEARTSWWEKGIDFVAGEAIQRYKQDSNQQILDRIYNDDADSKAKDGRLAPIISRAYMSKDITGYDNADTKRRFVEAITPDYSKGNRGISAFASNYGDGSEEQISSAMKDFTVDEMREILAKKAVYDQYLSPEMATTALNNEAMRYIKNHQGSLRRLGLFGRDVLISAASYTADKINGINNLLLMADDKINGMPSVYIDENSNIVDTTKNKIYRSKDGSLFYKGEDGAKHTVHSQQIARTTLHNMGKKEDGSDEAEGFFHLNPQYWSRAEQFGTLDADKQKQYEKIGSSPYKVAYDPNEDADLIYESFKMMSFGIADAASMLVPFGVGMAGRAISTASKAGKVAQGFGKALNTTGKYLTAQTKIGSTVQGVAGAGGIAYAYQRGAFQETLAQNLANVEEAVFNASRKDIFDQYNGDKDFKKATDMAIAARAAELKEAYITQNAREGNQIIDSPELNQMLHDKAQEQVLGEMVQQRFDVRKQSDEYAQLQQKAIDSAGDAATTTFIPEAIKYGLVNTIGFRKFWYSNPKQLTKQASKNFKGLGEVTTETGKKRMAVTSRYSTMKGKAKQLGKVAAGQFWGGAWTNGTDDMMVDAAERINEDKMNKYLQAYQSGEAIADVYGLSDGLYSYWKGLQNSLGQRTTYQATAVGGFGGMVSATPNMANIAHLATKEGRQAFRDTYKKRPVYEEVDGIKVLKRGEDGKPIMEDVSWTENWRERANYFIQNGVLNNYYANKASEREMQQHADYLNELLDREDDFRILTDLVASDIVLEDELKKRDELTGRFTKAIKTIEGLNMMANDSHDPASLSSVVTGIKDMISKAANNELTQEEAIEQIKQYCAQHDLDVNEENSQKALDAITKNAQDLQKAFEIYDKAEKQVQKVEKSLGRRISSSVRESMKLSQAWTNHWEERLKSMRDEIGDVTTRDTETSKDNVIAALGNKKNAGKALLAYALQEKELEENLLDKHKATEEASKKVREAQETLDKAQNNDEQYQAQMNLTQAQDELESAQQDEIFYKDLLDKSKQKKQIIIDAMETSKDEETVKVLSADEIMGLDAFTRARMLDPENRTDYSEEQQREIKKLEDSLINKDGEALQKIQDIAILTNEIARNEDAYSRMAQHPEAAAVQLEKQRKEAAERAKEIIDHRNARTLADFTKEMDDALMPRRDITQEQRANIAFSILKHYNPKLLDTIEKEQLLPEFTQQIHDAKEWSKLASDLRSEIDNLTAVPEWKKFLQEKIGDVIEHSSDAKSLMKNLEGLIDYESNEQIAQSIERVMGGLESKGHLRDTLVVENRKQRQQREEAARKKLKEEQKKEEAARKAAEEAATKEKATVDNSPKVGEIKTGEEVSLDGEAEADASGTVAEEKPVESKKPLWSEMVNYFMEDDAEAGKIDAGEVWFGKNKGVLTVSLSNPKELYRGSHLIKFTINDTPISIEVDGEAWKWSTDDAIGLTQEQAKAAGVTKEMPFNVKSIEKINGVWYFNGNFAGQNTVYSLRVKNNFNLAQTIENHRNAKEAEAVASGVDISNPNIVEGEEYVQASSPDLLQQAEETQSVDDMTNEVNDAEEVNKAGEQAIDESINTLSGNAMPLYDNVALKEEGILKPKEGKDPKDKRNWYNKWMATFTDKNDVTGIKLDDIVSTELSRILAADPHTKLKFMCTPASPKVISEDPRTAPAKDNYVGNHLFLVIDYDKDVEKIHNKENGGVIENEGNKYLIVGVVGYGNPEHKDPIKADINKARRDNWYNNIFGAGANNRGLQRDRKAYFDKHPGERFRVLKDENGVDVTTEIIPNSLIPGYIVKQTEVDDHIDTARKLSDILEDKARNPKKWKLEDLKWIIQELTQTLVIKESPKNVMSPRNREANSGRVFVLIPAANGKYAPAHINPLFYAGIQEGRLKHKVEEYLRRLTAPGRDQYATRLKGLNELLKIFYLKGDNTILLGKPGIDNITLVKDGKQFYTKHFDAFDFQEFMEAFKELNPRVNITAQVLRNKALLEEYDEAGALTTDCAMLRTAGGAFAIYPVDSNFKMVVPENASSNKPQRDRDFVDEHRQTVMYKNERYLYDVDKKQFFSPKGTLITDDSTLESLEYNRQVRNGQLLPIKSTVKDDYYILSSGEHPAAIQINKIDRSVTKLSEAEAQKLIEEEAKKQDQERRRQNAEGKIKATLREDVTLEDASGDFIIDDNTGEMIPVGEPQDTVAQVTQSQEKEKIAGSESEISPEVREEKPRENVTIPGNKAATQDFRTLAKNKKYKMRLLQEIAQKWKDSPVQFEDGAMVKTASWDEVISFLKNKGVNTEVIGTTDTDIEAWIHTNITCK